MPESSPIDFTHLSGLLPTQPSVDTLQKNTQVILDWSLFEGPPTSQPSAPPARPPPPRVDVVLPERPPPPVLAADTVRLRIPQPPAPASTASTARDTKQGWAQQKVKIVEDLLLTETTYLSDLNAWEAVIRHLAKALVPLFSVHLIQ